MMLNLEKKVLNKKKNKTMNKLFLTLALAVLGTVASAQNVFDFTRQTGGGYSYTDTIWVQENQIIKITKTTGGSSLLYFNKNGDLASANVRERTSDTAAVSSSISIVFSGAAGSIDSILINGVNIIANPVSFTSNITTTVAAIEDSIDAQTQSPVNYTAANADSTLTISAPSAFGDTANGYTVVIYTTTLTSSAASTMTGGFTVVRDVLLHTDRIMNVTVGGASLGINADRITELIKTSTGSVIGYQNPKGRTIESTDSPSTIKTAVNAL